MALINRQQSRVSITSDTRLPAIREAPSRSSLKSFKTPNCDIPSRRNVSRSSVASTVMSDSGISLCDSSVTSGTSRSSLNERRSTIDLTKSEKIMEKVEQRRRSTMLQTYGRKFSFGNVGKRITTLIKAKNAFAMFRARPKQFEEETIEDDKAFQIDNLPQKPRFASTLSAEAQYAMMKGYEDVVYSNLCKNYPEYRPMLRRNRTPHTGITVSAVKGKHGKISDKAPGSYDEKEESDDALGGNVGFTIDSNEKTGPVTTSTPEPGKMSSFSPRKNSNPSPVSVLNSSAEQMPCDILSGSSLSRSKIETKYAMSKARGLPEKQTEQKQLVMTHRYQRAMDILDNLRLHQGIHVLSPRVKKSYHTEPLKDYNSWSHVWTHEFEPKKANTITTKA